MVRCDDWLYARGVRLDSPRLDACPRESHPRIAGWCSSAPWPPLCFRSDGYRTPRRQCPCAAVTRRRSPHRPSVRPRAPLSCVAIARARSSLRSGLQAFPNARHPKSSRSLISRFARSRCCRACPVARLARGFRRPLPSTSSRPRDSLARSIVRHESERAHQKFSNESRRHRGVTWFDYIGLAPPAKVRSRSFLCNTIRNESARTRSTRPTPSFGRQS